MPEMDITANELLVIFFFGLVWPPLITMLACGVAGWVIPRIHWLVGVGLGIPMGAVNIPLSFMGTGWINHFELVRGSTGSQLDYGFLLAVQMFFILLGSGIPVLGMLWWSRRRQAQASDAQGAG